MDFSINSLDYCPEDPMVDAELNTLGVDDAPGAYFL
jgi:hypothetical protein